MNKARALGNELNVGDIELRNIKALATGNLESKDIYCTFRRPISSQEDENMSAIPRKQRAMVRKALKENMTVEFTQELDTFYAVYSESVRNLGTPVFSKKYFRLLQKTFQEEHDILLVKDEHGSCVAAVLSFYYQDQVLPYYGGSTPKARVLRANDYMYWQLMCHAASKGVKTFDFGRSKVGTGPYSFKKNWGFEPTPLEYQHLLINAQSMPELNPNNPRYRYLIAMWKKLPLPIANLVGPVLSTHLS